MYHTQHWVGLLQSTDDGGLVVLVLFLLLHLHPRSTFLAGIDTMDPEVVRNPSLSADMPLNIRQYSIKWDISVNQLKIKKYTKSLRETQTLRAGCIGGAKNFRPAADPFTGARDGQNLIS